jgi:hypothetical protein
MAVTNTKNKDTYACDGTTKTFDLGIKVFALSEVVVSVKRLSTGAVTTLVVDVDYTITSISGSLASGVRITTLPATAYSSDYTITLLRTIATTQNLELEVGGDLPANELEDALDRGVMISQQITEKFNRTIEFPVTDPIGTTYTAGTVEERANKACGYDANGNVTELDLAASGSIAVDTTKGLALASNIVSAKVDDSTLEFGTLGVFQAKDLGITAAKLASDSVTTAKILNSNVTKAKIENLTNMRVLGNVSGSAAAPAEVVILDSDTMTGATATNIPSAESVKAYVDTAKAAIEMKASTQVLLNTTITSATLYQDVDLSTYIGANAAFIHISVERASAGIVEFRTKGETANIAVGTSYGTIAAGDKAYFSLVTSSDGIIELRGNVTGTTKITLLAYQVLQ